MSEVTREELAEMRADARCGRIRGAIADLRHARNVLVEVKAPRAAKYVARALKSVEGALRHGALAPYRERRQARRRGS